MSTMTRLLPTIVAGLLFRWQIASLISLLLVPPLTLHAQTEFPVVDKTLVAWVSPANLTQRGGSVLTLEDAQAHFDAIVFGEIVAGRWMAGSDFYRRTTKEQADFAAELAYPDSVVQIAIVYRGPEVIIYRNGTEYSRHTITQPQIFDENSLVVIGPRHKGQHDSFVGKVDDARIYASALTADQLAQLQPNIEGPYKPWAWWSFEDSQSLDHTGRFRSSQLMNGASIDQGDLVLPEKGAGLLAFQQAQTSIDDHYLHLHLMHPGEGSLPGDPNAAFSLDGIYHLHYILAHPWQNRGSFSFVHVTSRDMLHWQWQSTKLQPAFTGHGMFSGTGFVTKEGQPAAIYHGESSGRNQIAIATDRHLNAWEKPYPVEVHQPNGKPADIKHWDPDCFLIGDTYYAISGGENPPLFRSKDLRHWTLVGNFLKQDLPDVAYGEDISCPNFFPIGDKWMLLCISHPLGCRYYVGDWDPMAEQFVPQSHGRMNWRRENQTIFGIPRWRVDYFAPESLLTPDGRRVMWAWCATVDTKDGRMSDKTIQSLPRELSLDRDHQLRIRPLRELQSLRLESLHKENVELRDLTGEIPSQGSPTATHLADLPGDPCEIQLEISHAQATRKLCGVVLFADGKGSGLPIMLRPETGTIRVGSTEAPFAVSELPDQEDITIRIFIDKYLVEVFVNDRQAIVSAYQDYQANRHLSGFTVGAPTTFKRIDIWPLKATNAGLLEAQKSRVWQPAVQ